MESGLEDRNNIFLEFLAHRTLGSLNGVRPRRPEQFEDENGEVRQGVRLNGVRPRRPEQYTLLFKIFLQFVRCLNGVRPRRPEQFRKNVVLDDMNNNVSMESGLEDRNNRTLEHLPIADSAGSQWSPA